MPVLDAKKKAFFCALYRGGERLCPDMDSGPAEIAAIIAAQPKGQTLLIGSGAAMLHEQLAAIDPQLDIIAGTGLRWGNAETLLSMAQKNGITECNTDFAAGPHYIRKSDAEIELGKR